MDRYGAMKKWQQPFFVEILYRWRKKAKDANLSARHTMEGLLHDAGLPTRDVERLLEDNPSGGKEQSTFAAAISNWNDFPFTKCKLEDFYGQCI